MQTNPFYGQPAGAAISISQRDDLTGRTQPLRKTCLLRAGVEVIRAQCPDRTATKQLYPPLT
jgi:hypothetical protein